MASRRSVSLSLAVMVGAAVVATSLVAVRGQTAGQAAVRVDNDDVGGVVTGPRGPEAGVWVIAETTELPTPLRKIVVTDDHGRFLVPDLPKANYDVWVRGYGLVDSAKTKIAPGKQINLTAVPAPNAKAAAEYYPAQYWLALLKVPPKSDFPGTGPTGNGIAPTVRSQGEWIRNIVNTDGCTGCHQMGNKATREIPKASARSRTPPRRGNGACSPGRPAPACSTASTRSAGARAGDVGGLDRPHRRRRRAGRRAAAAAGSRAQRRGHDVGLGRSQGLPARRDRLATSAIRP